MNPKPLLLCCLVAICLNRAKGEEKEKCLSMNLITASRVLGRHWRELSIKCTVCCWYKEEEEEKLRKASKLTFSWLTFNIKKTLFAQEWMVQGEGARVKKIER